jgi:hypothetical protein
MRRHILTLCSLFFSACTSSAGSNEHPQDQPDASANIAPDTSVSAAPDAESSMMGQPDAAMLPDATSSGQQCTGDDVSLLPKGSAQLAMLCGRGYQDPISRAFCAATPPTITSLDDVLKTLGLAFGPGPFPGPATSLSPVGCSAANGNPGFMLTAHSTSLSTRRVSQINPRTILFSPPLSRGRVTGTPQPNPTFVAMGFARGEQQIEMVAKDPSMTGSEGNIRFFLLRYQQACNSAPGGCQPGDLYTPAVESNFTSWSLYDDSDLKNTSVDCLECHQPGGPGTTRIMRMQELQRPWQHWMYNDAAGVHQLRADFHAAHGMSESYGGIPGAAMDCGDVQHLEAFIENNGYLNQPNEFKGATIFNELAANGTSATWQAQYQAAENGQFIPVPFYDFRATNPTKVQALIQQYSQVMSGALPPAQLGDMADVFDDSAQRAMTHKPATGLSGRQILVQVCQQCHNSHLDQTISRARFDVEKLDTLPRAEKDEAIRRINLPVDDCSHMPPFRFRELDAQEINLVNTELQR